jgi:N utilization substance protein B
MSSPRHQAREAALQVLYLWEVGRTDPEQALETFFAIHDAEAPEPVRDFARAIVLGTVAEVGALDEIIGRHSEHWRVERLAVIDRLILRMAAWELLRSDDTPPAVVLNEALELARTFSSEESVKFVNGVLDGIRKSL